MKNPNAAWIHSPSPPLFEYSINALKSRPVCLELSYTSAHFLEHDPALNQDTSWVSHGSINLN